NYQEAKHLYNEAMNEKKEESNLHLASLDGFIRSAYKGELLSREALLIFIEKGLRVADKTDKYLYTLKFTMLKYKILNETDEYLGYIKEAVLPFLEAHGA